MAPITSLTRMLSAFAGVCAVLAIVLGLWADERWPIGFAALLFVICALMFIVGEFLGKPE